MKKFVHCIFSLVLIAIFTESTRNDRPQLTYLTHMTHLKTFSLLSLGDSYTIGESVLLVESFPYQAVQMLRKEGYEFSSPEIVAKTGWTTDELQNAIDNYKFLPSYHFVTLLIGVNNQYRGRSAENYKPEFEKLLKQAIGFSGGKPDHVIVLSIPDWGVTPFATGRDRNQIGKEIDEYNAANKKISAQYQVNYIDITTGTRESPNDPSLVTTDGLHPSAKDYYRWAKKLADKIKANIK